MEAKYDKKQNEESLNPEKTLNVIAKIILVLGIILSILLFFIGGYLLSDVPEKNVEIGIFLLSSIIYVLPMAIVIWALFKVICNISNNLYQINSKMK